MSRWFFIGLDSFVDQFSSFLEKSSLPYRSLSSAEFKERKKGIYPQVLFFNGESSASLLQDQIEWTRPKDIIYLVLDSSKCEPHQLQEINSFLIQSGRIGGVVDLALGAGFVISGLRGVKKTSDLLFEEEMGKEYIEHFEQSLAKIKEEMSGQLKHVKHLHRSLVPLRKCNLGSLKTVSHYRVGESSHSEFWDIVFTKNQQLVFLLSTQDSGHLSKALGSIVEFFKEKSFNVQKIQDFYQYLKQIIQEEFSVAIMLFQEDKGEVSLVADGKVLFFLNGEEVSFIEKGKLSCLSLKSRDKLFVVSSGMVKNYDKYFKRDELMRMLKRGWNMPSDHFIHRIFFEAKLNQSSKFYDYDGVVLVFEVMS